MNAFLNIWRIPELRKRVLFSLMMIAVYRIGIFVTIPGVNRTAMRAIFRTGGGGGFLGLFSLFSGGAIENLSIFALGIMPYVTSSIVIQLVSVLYKPFEDLRKEGESGQRKLNQYTRYLTVLISIVQGYLLLSRQIVPLNSQSEYGDVVRDPNFIFYFTAIVGLTTGTAFLMWMGEQITERGIGNGISLIIFAGIVADLPDAVIQTIPLIQSGEIQPVTLLVVAAVVFGVISVIVYFERAQRRIPIHYARRTVGQQVLGGTSTHLPLRVNSAGVVPPIFASSLLMFPGMLPDEIFGLSLTGIKDRLRPGSFEFGVLYVVLIIFFDFFYTSITQSPVEIAENLKKQSAFIPKVRPGKETAQYLDGVLTRITWAGGIYVAAICLLPDILIRSFRVPFVFGGTSLMIVVGVALDTVQQIEAQLIERKYEGLMGPGGPRIRGRREISPQGVGAS